MQFNNNYRNIKKMNYMKGCFADAYVSLEVELAASCGAIFTTGFCSVSLIFYAIILQAAKKEEWKIRDVIPNNRGPQHKSRFEIIDSPLLKFECV